MEYKYFGYWNDILDSDEKLLPDYDQTLEELYDGTDFCAMSYLHGYCTFFAYQLARKYSLPIYAVKDYENNLLHTWCEYEDEKTGETWLLDIRGATTNTNLFFDEFEVSIEDEDWYTFERYGPAHLNKFYTHYIHSEYDNELDKKMLANALNFIKAIFK